jgi:hypothetical protein
MTCDAIRDVLLAASDATWPSGVLAHLAECETCAALAVEITLQRAPAVSVPATFAADVARRARLEASPPPGNPRGLMAGVCVATVVMAAATAWLGTVGAPDAATPAAVLLLSGGEAIVLAVWASQSDVLRARPRG